MAKTTEEDQDPKTPTGAADVRSVVETANAADENRKPTDPSLNDDEDLDDDDEGDDDGSDASDDSKKSDDANGDDDEEDEEDEEKPDDKKVTGDRKFTQFAGDGTDDQYISNLEKGYQNSSQEAIRLNTELGQSKSRLDSIMRAAANDPELATKLNAAVNGASDDGNNADDLTNPFVKDLETRWQETSEKEIAELLDANPQVLSDPELGDKVKHWMNVFSTDHKNTTGKLMTGGEAMKAAFNHLGIENKLDKQNLADGAKKLAAPTRHKGSKKKASGQKKEFTADQIAMAQNMGYSAEKLEKFAK